jgi:hypothetical protein
MAALLWPVNCHAFMLPCFSFVMLPACVMYGTAFCPCSLPSCVCDTRRRPQLQLNAQVAFPPTSVPVMWLVLKGVCYGLKVGLVSGVPSLPACRWWAFSLATGMLRGCPRPQTLCVVALSDHACCRVLQCVLAVIGLVFGRLRRCFAIMVSYAGHCRTRMLARSCRCAHVWCATLCAAVHVMFKAVRALNMEASMGPMFSPP